MSTDGEHEPIQKKYETYCVCVSDQPSVRETYQTIKWPAQVSKWDKAIVCWPETDTCTASCVFGTRNSLSLFLWVPDHVASDSNWAIVIHLSTAKAGHISTSVYHVASPPKRSWLTSTFLNIPKVEWWWSQETCLLLPSSYSQWPQWPMVLPFPICPTSQQP